MNYKERELLLLREEINDTIKGSTKYILKTCDLNREDRLCPSDYRVFTTNPLSISYGACGIAYYLNKVLGDLPDSIKGWIFSKKIDDKNYPPGLYVGLSGIGWALLDMGYREKFEVVAPFIYNSPLLYEGPDIFYGAAGWGLASLYFWLKTSDEKFLHKAYKAGKYLIKTRKSDKGGYYWTNVDGDVYFGFAHGTSGIATFLLYLYLAKKEKEFLESAIKAMDFEIAHAFKKEDYLTWPRSINDNQLLGSYWQYGSAGVGEALIRFYIATGEKKYLKIAEKCAKDAARKYTVFPSQFRGLSGMGEFLLDMYYFTKNNEFLRQAEEVAEGVLLFSIKRPEGIAFPGDELMRISNDYGTGSAGIGMFLHRLLTLEPRVFVLDELLKGKVNW